MAAGSIVIDLLMKTGSFVTDTDRAAKSMKKMKAEAEAMGKAVGAAFVAMGAAAVYAGKQVVDGLDALNDMADATGSTVEKLSALEDVAVRTGTSVDTVTAALVKFNSSLAGAKAGDDVSNALKAIGLSAAELKELDPADALLKTAQALAKFADDGDKARLVQELFGKSVKEVGPYLKDLATQSELVATVTKEEAAQAEAFNKQLFAMQKNASDLGRSIMSGLLPALNAWSTVLKEGGILAFLGLGGNQVANPGEALDVIGTKLRKLRQEREALDPQKGTVNKINDFLFGDVADLDRQIKLLEAEERALRKLHAAVVPLDSEAMRRAARGGSAPSVGPLPPKATGGGGGKAAAVGKPYATSDRWDVASAAEAEARMMNEAQEAWAKYADQVVQTEKPIDTFVLQMTDAQEMMLAMGDIGTSALGRLAIEGAKLSDVFKDVLMQLARMVFQIGVVQPLMAQITQSMGGGVTPPNPAKSGIDWGGLLSSVVGAFGGAKAGGGDVMPGRGYTVGEHGPETFVPRTFGTIAPAGAGAGGSPFQIINQTTGRVDNVQWDAGRRAAILSETRRAMAADVGDPNSAISQAIARHTTARRNH